MRFETACRRAWLTSCLSAWQVLETVIPYDFKLKPADKGTYVDPWGRKVDDDSDSDDDLRGEARKVRERVRGGRGAGRLASSGLQSPLKVRRAWGTRCFRRSSKSSQFAGWRSIGCQTTPTA